MGQEGCVDTFSYSYLKETANRYIITQSCGLSSKNRSFSPTEHLPGSSTRVLTCQDNHLSSYEHVWDTVRKSTWIVDALLGTGLTGETRSPYRELIGIINSISCPVLSIDLPSGLDCDRGMALGTAVHATHTATLVAPKKGFTSPGASSFTGLIHTLDIGIPRKLIASLVH